MNFNTKKVAAAVATALGVSLAGGIAQADEILFPYVVSSPTVTTVLSVVNTKVPTPLVSYTLHWRYYYKEGADATDNSASCQEIDLHFSSSQGDLVDVDVDEHYGSATRGILFNDPSTNAPYAPTTHTLALLHGLTQPIRAFAIVDNNEDAPFDPLAIENSLAAGHATILEFINGAAWGYTAYNSNAAVDSYDWSEVNERFGEVFGPGGAMNGNVVSFKPFNEWATLFFVTPISSATNTDAGGAALPVTQLRGNLQTRVRFAVPGGAVTDVVTDRDEVVVSGNQPQDVVCVGAVNVQDLLSTGAQNFVADTGGWATLQSAPPQGVALAAAVPGDSHVRTEEATIEFLEHNGTGPAGAGGGVFNGEAFPGVVNNGYMLQEQ